MNLRPLIFALGSFSESFPILTQEKTSEWEVLRWSKIAD